jgi:ABC-type antimicrobial peptide transport system permease subunit
MLGIVLETVLTASAGIAVGVAAAYSLGATIGGPAFGSKGGFVPDMATLLPAVGVVYAAVILVTALPAIQASRLRPAEALRILA